MKQALFILAAFLLVAPCIAMGQDFEVLNAPGGKLTLTVFKVVDANLRIDTIVRVHNKTTTPLSITLNITGSWSLDTIQKVTIPSSATIDIPIYIRQDSYSKFKGTLSIVSSTTTEKILLTAEIFPHITSGSDLRPRYIDYSVLPGTSSCMPIKATNNTTQPMNIYGYSLDDAGRFSTLTVDTLIPPSYVILPGESVILLNICYAPKQPNQELYQSYYINFSLDGKNFSCEIDATYSSSSDTTLLKPCVEIVGSGIVLGPIIFNGTAETTVTLKSNRYTAQNVTSVAFQDDVDGVFHVKGNPFPIKLDSLASVPLTFEFTPTLTKPVIKDRFSSKVSITSSQCATSSFSLAGLALQPTADSISTPLFPDKEYVLGMSSSAPSFSQDFHFVNNGLTNTKIVSVGLADPSPEFVVTNITPTNSLPFTLLPGEKMTVSVLFTPSQVGKVFFNQLLITTEQGIQSVSYPLQGIRTMTSGVQGSSDSSVTVTLNPNPATTSVTVSVKGAGIIEEATMNNTIGNMVLLNSRPAKPEWTWDVNPNFIMRGVYFVRITGKTPDGKPFVASRRLVVE